MRAILSIRKMFNPSSGRQEQTSPLLCPARTVHSALIPSQTPLAAHALSARPFMHFVPFANTGFGGHLSDTPAGRNIYSRSQLT